MDTCAQTHAQLQESQVDEKRQFDVARMLNTMFNTIECKKGNTVLNSRPLKLGLDISDACNANCIFCLAHTGRKGKTNPDAFRSPDWLDNFNGLLPFISLGIFSSFEALLNPNFPEFVDKLHKFHTPFQIFTNGKALNKDIAEYILRKGLDSIHCSFHSPNPKTYESIMRGLSFDETMQNLMQFKLIARKYNPECTLVMVFCAMRRNIHQLLEYVDLAHRVGAKFIQVNYLLVTTPAHEFEGETMFFNQTDYDDYVLDAKLKALKLGITLQHQPTFFGYQPINEEDMPPCYKPWQGMNVSKDGDVTICCGGSGAFGNIFKQDFFEVWNSRPFRKFRELVNSPTPPSNCLKCSRGRENPHAIENHITYLKGLPEEERQVRSEELFKEYGR